MIIFLKKHVTLLLIKAAMSTCRFGFTLDYLSKAYDMEEGLYRQWKEKNEFVDEEN